MDAFIFDVDGVLTNPVEKHTTPEILDQLKKILERGDTIAFNTGRSFVWLEKRIIQPFSKKIDNSLDFNRILAVCEKGNHVKRYEKSKSNSQVYRTSVPKSLEKKVKKLIENNFSESMFFDDSKLTMISTEMNDDFDNKKYLAEQKKLEEELKNIISDSEYNFLNLRIDPSQIALDIQDKDAGKHLGAKRIEDWFNKRGFSPKKIYMFGDSNSDIEMAEELERLYPLTFVFVNGPEKLDASKLAAEVAYTEERFEKGTLEFLRTQNT